MNINIIAVESGSPLVESDLLAVERLSRRLPLLNVWPTRDQRGRFVPIYEEKVAPELIAAAETLQAFVDRCRRIRSAERPARQP